jgi:acetate kinase
MLLLALNVGSSSIKSAVFDMSDGCERCIWTGTLTTRARQTVALVTRGQGARACEERAESADGVGGVVWLLARLEREGLSRDLAAVGHRLVHGGMQYRVPVWLTPQAMADLRQLVPLAPDHLPAELAAIDAVAGRWPQLRQAAAFDTAFHRDLPSRARLFGVPRRFTDAGVVRFGFHGLSYEYVVAELRAAGALDHRTVVAHLGSGASLAALLDGRSIDTTMGFTPTGGIIMATRSGDLDPGVMLYLARTQGLSMDALSQAVNVDGGLAGVSGTTGDMRTLLDTSGTDPRAADAVELFCYQASKLFAACAAALEGLDAMVFTGGIGERAAVVRSRVCERLAWCGVTLDDARNAAHAPVISVAGAPVTVRIVPTNEELIIARHIHALLGTGESRGTS